MSIAILCPTRARRDHLWRMIESALNTATIRVEFWCMSEDTKEVLSAVPGVYSFECFKNHPTAMKWNMLAKKAMQAVDINLFMLGADDMIFDTSGWDKALLDHYNALDNKIHVYALQDSRDPEGTPHPIVTREWIEAMGYAFPPIFLHWFLDTWTVEIAKANGVFTHMKDYLLIHDKPSDRGQPDSTHSRIREWGWHERDKWVDEHCRHFLTVEKARLAGALAKPNRLKEWIEQDGEAA